VLRYAEPLLAERAFIAEQAQLVEIRRSGGGATLRQTATLSLGLDDGSPAISWDAWRRDDGKWIIAATYAERGASRTAEWTYDHAGRNIHPLDDQARALMGVRTLEHDRDAIADALDLVADIEPQPEPDPRPRLVAVPDAQDEDEEAVVAPASAETVTIPHPSGAPATAAPATAPAPKPAARKAKPKKGGRASVPSWDEILFGATRPDDQS
jgi:hypothetical protein